MSCMSQYNMVASNEMNLIHPITFYSNMGKENVCMFVYMYMHMYYKHYHDSITNGCACVCYHVYTSLTHPSYSVAVILKQIFV